MSQRTIIHKRISLPAVITITLPDFIDLEQPSDSASDNSSDDDNDDFDLITFLDDITHIQESRQGDYQYILSRDIPKQHKNKAIEYLMDKGWTPDKNLTNPDTGKRGSRGYKKLL